MVEIKKAMCGWCQARCKVAAHIENNHLVKVTDDPDFPMPVWPPIRACPRALAAKEYMYHPDRLNYPLKRLGERGEGKWQRITWKQAFDEIASRLGEIRSKYGAEALASGGGTGRPVHHYFHSRFLNLFGTPNIVGPANICHGPAAVMSNVVWGWYPYYIQVDPTQIKTQCMLLWGRAPEQSWPTEWYFIRKIKETGGKLIVIDPRYTKEASMADLHLQLRPGTDCALALSLINVIIEENLYDKDFVKKWCYGFEKLRERAQQYPPEKVEGITWIAADKIREAARMYAGNKPATISVGMGVEHLANNAETLHARYILPAITGNVNVEGGEIITGPHPKLINEVEIELTDMLPEEQRRKQLGADRFKLFTFPGFQKLEDNTKKPWGKRGGLQFARCNAHAHLVYNAAITGEPYPIKALLNSDHNPIITHGNAKLVYKAYKKVDLHVVFDTFMTPSVELADYALPAACWLEKPHLFNGVGNLNYVTAGERALSPSIPGEYDHRDEYDFWRELGIRLGQEKYWPWKSIEEVYDYRLQPMGYTFEQFMKEKRGVDFTPLNLNFYEEKGFGTPTGKIELSSTILEGFGYDPLPTYREPSESPISQPQLSKEYPYILITGGRHKPFYHSEHRQIDSLRKQYPYPITQINPETAKELGINDGDWVWIETPRGRVRQKCKYFNGIHKKVIHADHGWWFPELPGEEPWLHGVWESNINVCGNDEPDVCNPILGSWPLKTFLCKVYKVKEYK